MTMKTDLKINIPSNNLHRKVLILSNMYPSEQKPYSGIFVKNQFDAMNERTDVSTELYALKRTFTGKMGSIWKYLKFYFRFLPLLFRKFDVIHVHFFGYHFLLAYVYKIFRPGTKVIVTVHGSDTVNFSKKGFRWLAKRINTIVAVGEEQAVRILKFFPKGEVKVICAGVSAKTFYKVPSEKEYDFLFVGSFYQIKGVDILIEAIKELKEKNARFCFVGSGKYQLEIQHLKSFCTLEIKENLDQEALRTVINKSKFLVLPSRGDAFGLVVTESMFCGTPAIVSNIASMKQQINDNYNGFVLEENTVSELSDTLKRSLNLEKDEYARIAANALASNKQFGLSNVVNQLVTIYQH